MIVLAIILIVALSLIVFMNSFHKSAQKHMESENKQTEKNKHKNKSHHHRHRDDTKGKS